MSNEIMGWPQHAADRYRSAGYWRGKPLGDWMWELADRHADRVALVDGEVRLTYRELASRADVLATGLRGIGLVSGDTILVQLPNCWEFMVLTFACFRIGVAPIMALPAHRHRELRGLIEHGRAKAIVVANEHRGFDHQELALQLRDEIDGLETVLTVGNATERDPLEGRSTDGTTIDLRAMAAVTADVVMTRAALDTIAPASSDVALFLLSGGTTGLPKLIPRTHDDYEYNARRSGEVCEFDADTVFLVVLPAAHNFALACPGILGTLLVGGKAVMLVSPEPAASFAAIQREGVTVTAAVPAVAQRWIDAVAELDDENRFDLSTLRTLQVGGARLAPEVARRVSPVLGCRLQQVFGMAEGLLNYTRFDDPYHVVCDTQGRPMSDGDEIRIVDDADESVPTGEMGLLLTRGPYTIRGYYDAPDHNALSFTTDGWYRTGDVVRLHPSGNLSVEGRAKDIINRAGEKISAEEVENLVYAIPDVARVAAVAAPDGRVGERICVFVVMRADAGALDLAALRDSLRALGCAEFKLPERLEVVDELPLTNVGKVDKRRLREEIVRRIAAEPAQG